MRDSIFDLDTGDQHSELRFPYVTQYYQGRKYITHLAVTTYRLNAGFGGRFTDRYTYLTGRRTSICRNHRAVYGQGTVQPIDSTPTAVIYQGKKYERFVF